MIAKLNKKGSVLMVIDDVGNVYSTSLWAIDNLTKKRTPFVVFSQLPQRVEIDRFPKSPLYDPLGVWQGLEIKDAISKKGKEELQRAVNVADKEI